MNTRTTFITDPFNLRHKSIDLGGEFPKTNWTAILNEGSGLDPYRLFIAHFKTIPLSAYAYDIDCKKANEWFLLNYSNQIRYYYQSLTSIFNQGIPRNEENIYVLFEDLIILIDTHCDAIQFCYRTTDLDKVNTLLVGFSRFLLKNSRREPRISILVSGHDGISLKKMKISKPRINLTDNYNDDLIDIHRMISGRLRKSNDKGLVLLHGKPGTGKTFYIRHLTAIVKKDVIFLPPHLASAVTNPDLIGIFIDNPNSIFVIEDAENIVINREDRENSAVSAILNMADGLLSDFLNIQIICSFNTDIRNIDSALTL
jgi:hypothetical protein